MMLHTICQDTRPCGFRQEVLFMFSLNNSKTCVTDRQLTWQDLIWLLGNNLNKLGRGPLGYATFQMQRL